MTMLQDVAAEELSRQVGVPVEICQVFLEVSQRREPKANIRIRRAELQPILCVTFRHDDMLELCKQDGLVTIMAFGGFPAGEQYCHIIVRDAIATQYDLNRAAHFRDTEVVALTDLRDVLSARLEPLFDRIARLDRQNTLSGRLRQWLTRSDR